LIGLDQLIEKPDLLRAAKYYRLAFRDVASSTNERTSIFCLLSPPCIVGNTAPCEKRPELRATHKALFMMGILNSFSFDWIIRQKTTSHLNLFLLESCPLPTVKTEYIRFLSHSALRLSCNHSGYASLWKEQVGETWREYRQAAFTWPVLVNEEARWEVKTAIDSIVADAYGLTRDQYEHILSSFSHSSYSRAPQLCLTKYDEVKGIGIGAFCKKHDPYWDIPLNEGLPLAIIEYPEFSIPQEMKMQKSFEFQPISDSTKGDETAFQNLVAFLRERGVVTSSDAQSLLNLNAATVRPVLRRLVDEGLAIVEGQKRGTRYVFKKSN